MDFYKIKENLTKKGLIEVYPDFSVSKSKDLMVRGKSFYAIWDEEQNTWSTNEYDVQRLVDADLMKYKEKLSQRAEAAIHIKTMESYSSKAWKEYRDYMQHLSDSSHQLDEELTFSNMVTKRSDYVSKSLSYPLEEGPYEAYEEMIGTLFNEEERAKVEWAIGAIIAGDGKDIQKFIVFYGEGGSGKSTTLNIIQKLFEGYYTTFDAKALTSNGNQFSTEAFKSNPLVAIQHDGDLSKIEDNTKLNSIIAHEAMPMNEKYKPSYTSKANCFLFMGTNKPVKITDAKSGIIRRLIDVRPSGRKIPIKRYHTLMAQIDFELGGIAHHCLQVYLDMGKNYYSAYRPIDMQYQTDVFFNFVEANYYLFKEQEGIGLVQAYDAYKSYCDETLVEFKLPRHKFREELKNYFENFSEMGRINGKQVRGYYSGFITTKFLSISTPNDEHPDSLVLECTESIFDEMCSDCPAQYASNDVPSKKWSEVETTLLDIDTKEVHFVKVPKNHIVIDFDIKEEDGTKSFEKNIKAASLWPRTYSEFSKSGSGLHLHYIYSGDVTKLSPIYDEGIEVKVYIGNGALRRKLTKCNNLPVITINSGLPLKGEKMINFAAVKSENTLRDLINRNLNKEIHPGTKSSIDFIYKILDDAYKSGLVYDITDLRPKILAFANNSTNQADTCIKLVSKMSFKSEKESVTIETSNETDLTFFDVEVFQNLFVVAWKKEGKECVKMINPKPSEMEELMKFNLVGYNCRRYDNHILYGRHIGYDLMQLYTLSQGIINGSKNCLFREAYNISYTDIYDFLSVKQSLKKFEIELGIIHQELGLKWDEPVPEELWEKVADYCCNDVIAEEAVFIAKKQDFVARQILADLSGLTVNDTTQMHTAKIIFGNDKHPQEKFIYTDLSEMFPGYVYDHGVSTYRGEETGEGGYVYAEPGMYGNCPVLDITSMHSNSLISMDMFGPYTSNFKQLLDARVAIKHKEYDVAKGMLNGILAKYLTNEDEAIALAYALKIVINIVYGLTSAKFDNPFKDPRNKDNIVAKRGALFMIDLKHAVQEKGFKVAHIKTDSIKIPNATPEIIQFVMDFGKRYGYTFEHEATYDKICLLNDAVYIARERVGNTLGDWVAVGAQFIQPYVFKTLFSKEPIVFQDMCETKAVTTALYLDMNETLNKDEHDYYFVGKIGSFCPIKPGYGGGLLMREKDEKYYAATNTKGYRWLEAALVKSLGKEEDIDKSFYVHLLEETITDISNYGLFDWFVSDKFYDKEDNEILPF